MACLRGLEPLTFGSGKSRTPYVRGIDGASERDRTSDLLITNQLLGHGLHVTSKMLMALTVTKL